MPVRPSTPADAPAIAKLLVDAGLRPNAEPEQLHWKYWLERSDWRGPRSFVLTRDNEILAHAGIVPGSCAWGHERARTIHMIDWAAQRSASGAGFSLMNHVWRLTDVLLSIGGSAKTRQILPLVGFRPYGAATEYVRTLRPLRLLKGVGGPAWKLLPRVMRSMLWTATAPSGYPGDWQPRRVRCEEVGALMSEFPVSVGATAVLERSESLFRYILTCPITPMELYEGNRGGHRLGYFLLAFAPGQARLVDCWVRSDRPDDWRALIQCAVWQARENPDPAELVTWASDTMLSCALQACGFHERGAQPIQLRVRTPRNIAAATLRVQMLDNDAAYYRDSGPALWV